MLKTIPKNLFIMYPVCVLLLKGDRDNPILSRRYRWIYLFAVILGIAGLMLLITSFSLLVPPPPTKDIFGNLQPQTNKGLEGFIRTFPIALLILFGSGWFFYTTIRRRTLEKTGQILLGKLVSIKGYYNRSYNVTAIYQFKNPAGTILKGKRKVIRNDLGKRELPLPGTPVAILYAHDHYYDIL